MTELNDLTPEQVAAFKALMQRPDLVKLLMEFGENMSAARRFSKWIAWLAGIATAIAALAANVMAKAAAYQDASGAVVGMRIKLMAQVAAATTVKAVQAIVW